MRAFCQAHGIDNALVSGWKAGRGADIESLRRLADGLGLTLGQVLVIAGIGTPDDFGGATPPEPRPPAPPSVDEAIERDPTLTTAERQVLREVRRFTRSQEAGVDTVTVRATKRQPHKRK
jgi:hypothetical protein